MPDNAHAASDPLWTRIDALELDDETATLTFSRRLARENGWSHAFARRVIDEYKRFVYLAMTAGHEVTPSDEVDQAWHLHLTYTRSYWQDLCGTVLGQPLHHGPTKGGEAEGARFEDQYERTLASYPDAFGEAPPPDIWPPAEVRFGEAAYFVRINTRRRRPALWGSTLRSPGHWRSGHGINVMLGAAAVGTLGFAPVLAETNFFFVMIVVAIVMYLLWRLARAVNGGGRGGDGGCSGFFGCGGDGGGCSSGCGGGCGGCGGCGG
ncbi:MAG: hypothetical protein AAGJ46_17970 [Planctomycetota bacterium]